MSTLHVKTGMEVKILAGKDRGKIGKVTQVFPKLNRVVVEGVNITKRHLRTRKQGESGRIVEFSMPIHASNVAPTAEDAKKTTAEAKPKRVRSTKKVA